MGLKLVGVLKGSVAVLAAGGVATVAVTVMQPGDAHHARQFGVATAVAREVPGSVSTTVPPNTAPPTTTAPTTVATTTTTSPAPQPATLAGCPVAPRPPGPPAPPPWHPAALVPDSALPPVEAPAPWASSLAAIEGKGMWVWLWSATDGGNAAAVVKRAQQTGLHQLWVRVGDSKNGFYGAAELDALVPVAHAAGIDVIAWGFPYLYDPTGDAAWTAQILAWRSPSGDKVDGYSADIERPSEGVDLTAQRVGVYLEAVRKSAGSTPIIATVYPPVDQYWSGDYPYKMMASYVDAFAPMVYWECVDPGNAAAQAVTRLSTLRPVHVIGQAFNMADVGGRVDAPSAAEIQEFLSTAKHSGAVGASLWVWQSATAEEWNSLSSYAW